jgi:hypothetical protein
MKRRHSVIAISASDEAIQTAAPQDCFAPPVIGRALARPDGPAPLVRSDVEMETMVT